MIAKEKAPKTAGLGGYFGEWVSLKSWPVGLCGTGTPACACLHHDSHLAQAEPHSRAESRAPAQDFQSWV